jgi:hypothetical protein
LELDALIESNIPEGVRFIARNAPYELLSGFEKETKSATTTDGVVNTITFTEPILRIISVYADGWKYALRGDEVLPTDDPLYRRQFSAYGVKANSERPMAFLRSGSSLGSNIDHVLEFYPGGKSLTAYIINDVFKDLGSGELYPNYTDTAYNLAVSYIAYLTALSLGDEGLAQRMLAKYNSIIGTTNQQV